jgi:hypothetical protein
MAKAKAASLEDSSSKPIARGHDAVSEPENNNNNNDNNERPQQECTIIQDNQSDAQQDLSEALSAEVIIGEPVEPQPPLSSPALPAAAAAPAEAPSTSNNALIIRVKILSEYAKDIHRSIYAAASAGGFHREHVRRAISNFVTAIVDNEGDVERLQQIYTEGNYSSQSR